MNKKSAIGFPALILLIWMLFFAGWGFDDLASFFAHPARVGLVIVGVVAVGAGVIVCRDVPLSEEAKTLLADSAT